MDKTELISVLSELHKISGFRISLHGVDFEKIASYPENKLAFCSYIQKSSEAEYQKCLECDKQSCRRALEAGETVIYTCHNGFVEAISPLYNFGALAGYLMMGQVKVEGSDTDQKLLTLARHGKSDFEAREICAEIPSVKEDMIETYVHIMTICAQYLTLSNALTAAMPSVGRRVLRYISSHFTEKIGIRDICQAVGYSKSTVLTSFKKEFDTTVNTYLNNLRLNHAKKLLDDGSLSINDVALSSGFSDQSYFSKVFSGKYGITPSEYRKEGNK